MAKNVLKIVLLILLFISVVLVPVVGVEFYESPSVFDEDAVYCGHDFTNGSNVILSFTQEEKGTVKIDRAAEILEKRFSDYGYVDVKVAVENDKVKISLPMKDAVEDIVNEVCVNGKWSLTDLNGSEFCDNAYVNKAEVKGYNGYYYIEATINEDKASEIESSVNYVASSGAAYAYLSVDGENAAFIQVDSSMYSNGTLLIGPMNYSSVSTVLPIMNYGSVEGTFEIESISKDYAPRFSESAQKIIFIASAAVIVIASAALILVNKNVGIGAMLAVLANGAVVLTSLANRSFVFTLSSLIFMLASILVTWGINLFACIKTKDTKFGKVNITSIWIHLALFVLTVAVWMLAKGTLFTIGRILMIATVSSFATYFIFTYGFSCALKAFNADKQ